MCYLDGWSMPGYSMWPERDVIVRRAIACICTPAVRMGVTEREGLIDAR
jgi:hypothetical protein